jgi:hypothetical protein
VVTRSEAGDPWAYLLDHPGAFVTADHGQGDGHVTGQQMLVGVAHA